MKNKSILLTGLGLLAVYFGYNLFRYKQVADKLRFTIAGIGVKSGKIIISIGILNPTGVSATIRSMVGDLYNENAKIATITNFEKTIVRPNSSTIINITLIPNAIGIISAISDIISDGLKNKLRIVADANINNITVPINITA